MVIAYCRQAAHNVLASNVRPAIPARLFRDLHWTDSHHPFFCPPPYLGTSLPAYQVAGRWRKANVEKAGETSTSPSRSPCTTSIISHHQLFSLPSSPASIPNPPLAPASSPGSSLLVTGHRSSVGKSAPCSRRPNGLPPFFKYRLTLRILISVVPIREYAWSSDLQSHNCLFPTISALLLGTLHSSILFLSLVCSVCCLLGNAHLSMPRD